MRESALMDFLSEGDTGAGGEWLPTSEKVIGSAQLAEPVTVPSVAPGSAGGPSPAAVGEAPSPFLSAPASRFEPPGAGTVLDSNGLRPPGFGPPRRTSADEGGPPVLSAEDLDALEDLTYSELVQARGLDPDALERLGRLRLPRPSAAPASPAPTTPAASPPLASPSAAGRTPAPVPAAQPAPPLAPASASAPQPAARPAGPGSPRPAAAGSPRPAAAPTAAPAAAAPAPAPTGSPARPAAAPAPAPAGAPPGSPGPPAAAPSRPPVGPSLLAPAGLPGMEDDVEPAPRATPPRPAPAPATGQVPARPASPRPASARPAAAPAPGRPSYPARADQDPPVPAPPAETRSFTPAPPVEPPPPDPVVPATLARFGGAGIAPRREPPGAAPGSSLRATTAKDSPVVEDLPTWPPPGRPAAAPAPAQVDKGLGPVPSKYRPDPSRSVRRRRFLAACLLIAVTAVAVWYLAIRPRHHSGSAHQGTPAPAQVVSAGHPADLAVPLRHPGA